MEKKDAIKNLVELIGEYCHTRYLGCSQENGKWFYSYDNEVVNMLEDYFATPEGYAEMDNFIEIGERYQKTSNEIANAKVQ